MKRQREKHPTVHIKHFAMEAEVDEEIAPLILDLWKLNIDTLLS